MKRFGIVHFIILDAIACALVFGSALWGHCLLAPLDIAPALFSKYAYVSPEPIQIPANHHIIDQLTYDLPLQYTIYHSYRRGVIPWWDPYTWSGRPLLADAHISGTDPVRLLCYLTLPFELAYNWTRILHSFLCGLGMFLLLRHWQWNRWSCPLLALTYQFAGCHVMGFIPPSIQASFLYYPFLWLVWEDGLKRKHWQRSVEAGVLVACLLYAGNLQSHSYVTLFSAAFLFGYTGRSFANGKKIAVYLAVSLILGACLAAPVLLGQVDLFLHSLRPVVAKWRPLGLLGGLMSLAGVYPWILGTFRSLDLGKICDAEGAGFFVFIGSAGFLLAILGCFGIQGQEGRAQVRRTALALLVIYFGMVMSTPLRNIFYMRSAGLAVLGLIVLAGLCVEALLSDPKEGAGRAVPVLALAVSIAVATNAAAFWLYPRLIDKVGKVVEAYQTSHRGMLEAPALRQFQIRNLPNEVSFCNPETVMAFASLLALAVFLASSRWRKAPVAVAVLLGLNLIPVLLFSHRFLPHQPVELWRRLLDGGAEQRRVATSLGGTSMRVFEKAPSLLEQVFPLELSHLWRVRTVHGYSALQPKSLTLLSPNERQKYAPQLADYIYETPDNASSSGTLEKNDTSGLARFQWLDTTSREFVVHDVSLNEMRIEFAPGSKGTLLWTDTYYPGWIAEADGRRAPLRFSSPCFTTTDVGDNVRVLTLRYRPRFLWLAQILAVCGIIGIVVTYRASDRMQRNP